MGSTPWQEFRRQYESRTNNHHSTYNSANTAGNGFLKSPFLRKTHKIADLLPSLIIGTNKVQCSAPAPPPLPPIGASTSTNEASMPTPPPPSTTETPTTKGSSAPSSEAPPAPPSPEEESIAQAAANVAANTSIPNPGPYEAVLMPFKALTSIDTHDGMRCEIQKQLSPYMVVIHSFWLGTSMLQEGMNKSYSFVTQVADETGLLMARVDPSRGSVDGRIHKTLLGGLANGKLQIGVSSAGQMDQALGEVDFGGLTWTGNLKYGSMAGGIVYGLNYLQSINERWAAGGEGLYVSANGSLVSSYTLKYDWDKPSQGGEEEVQMASAATAAASPDVASNKGKCSFVAQYNSTQNDLGLHYRRVVTPGRVTIGAELSCNPGQGESAVTLGAEFQLTRSKFSVCVDGTGNLKSSLQAKLGMAPGSPTLSFTADVDHVKDSMRFGYGLNVGG